MTEIEEVLRLMLEKATQMAYVYLLFLFVATGYVFIKHVTSKGLFLVGVGLVSAVLLTGCPSPSPTPTPTATFTLGRAFGIEVKGFLDESGLRPTIRPQPTAEQCCSEIYVEITCPDGMKLEMGAIGKPAEIVAKTPAPKCPPAPTPTPTPTATRTPEPPTATPTPTPTPTATTTPTPSRPAWKQTVCTTDPVCDNKVCIEVDGDTKPTPLILLKEDFDGESTPRVDQYNLPPDSEYHYSGIVQIQPAENQKGLWVEFFMTYYGDYGWMTKWVFVPTETMFDR